MNASKLLTVAVVALVLIGGVATVGAAAQADVADDSTENAADNSTDENEADNSADASDERTDPPGEANQSENASVADERPGAVGPSDGLPEVVPDHVGEIHDTIESFLGGSLENLGTALSDLLSGTGDAESGETDDSEQDSSENAAPSVNENAAPSVAVGR